MRKSVFAIVGIAVLLGGIALTQIPTSTASVTQREEAAAPSCATTKGSTTQMSGSDGHNPDGMLIQGRCQATFCWADGLQCKNPTGNCTNGVGSCSYQMVQVSLQVCPAPDPLPPCFDGCG